MSGALEAGAVIGGRYRILKRLGVGGMGAVYLANTEGVAGFERLVALKIAHDHVAQDKNVMEMFLSEARLSAQLHHANVGQVHDLGQSEELYFIAMEYVRGVDLRALMNAVSRQGGRLPMPVLATISSKVLEGLDYAHNLRDKGGRPLKLVHRDVTPVNCLLSYTGDVKVIDFGIAKAADRASIKTKTGVVRGKLPYMSPEQLRGQPLDRRSDVWAVGVVTYEMLIGARPFDADNDHALMQNILGGRCLRPRERDREISTELDGIVMKALAVDRTQRFESAAQMQEALERYLLGLRVRVGARELAAFLSKICPPGDVQPVGEVTAPTGEKAAPPEQHSSIIVAKSLIGDEPPTPRAGRDSVQTDASALAATPAIPARALATPLNRTSVKAEASSVAATPAAPAPGLSDGPIPELVEERARPAPRPPPLEEERTRLSVTVPPPPALLMGPETMKLKPISDSSPDPFAVTARTDPATGGRPGWLKWVAVGLGVALTLGALAFVLWGGVR